ncbi:hypothetical protein ACIPJK_38180 [Streptomyces roseus]|uniref:hypothetical protein n=1 Tax=Streptomyces roseus TaxID=66430 RepID=UPI0037F18A3B
MEMGGRSAWATLAPCPERWVELVTHPTLGAAVQHLLLDQAEIQAAEDARTRTAGYLPGEDPDEELPAAEPAPALSEKLLLACLPALCLPELADLPNPQVTTRRTLHHIARRVDTNPCLAHLARGEAHGLRVRRTGAAPRRVPGPPQRQPDHLAGACAQLAALDQPAVVSHPPSRTLIRVFDGSLPADHDHPARLLERHNEQRRAEILAALAANPHTPHAAVTGALNMLHPAVPGGGGRRPGPRGRRRRCTDAAGRRRTGQAPRPRGRPAVLALLPRHRRHPLPLRGLPGPGQIPAPHAGAPVCQIPADEILSRSEPEIALTILLEHCGHSTGRWEALAAAMTFNYDDARVTFGELLDSLDGAPAPTPRS